MKKEPSEKSLETANGLKLCCGTDGRCTRTPRLVALALDDARDDGRRIALKPLSLAARLVVLVLADRPAMDAAKELANALILLKMELPDGD